MSLDSVRLLGGGSSAVAGFQLDAIVSGGISQSPKTGLHSLLVKQRLRVLFAAVPLLVASGALADQSTIKLPGVHPDYVFEAEPHVLVDPFDKFAPGVGFRGTIEIVDNGFVQSINNTVGIGFGVDWTEKQLRVPVVMQWNFWLSRNWSVFGEPGGVVRFRRKKIDPEPALYAGGRLHFSDAIALTMRVGHPTASVGVSFLL